MLDSTNRTLVFDAEANGLLETVTKMYCIVAQDYETEEMFLFHDYPEYDDYEGVDDEGKPFKLQKRDGSLKQGVVFLHKAKSLICHNCLGYDFELMRKFYPKFKIRYNYPEIRDTLLESQVLWYDRAPVKGYKGIHGLAVWGARLGIRKPEIEDWSFMDAEKLHRCLEDVKINTAVARQLESEKDIYFNKCNGIVFERALEIEHEYRYWSTIQELNGALVDAPHMERCIVELDGLIAELKGIIEPQLPPTIRVRGSKATSHEVAKLVGVPSNKVPAIRYELRTRKGETKEYPIKAMYKPVTKWANITAQKMYSVEHNGVEIRGHDFEKLKYARDWVKVNHPDLKKVKYPSITIKKSSWDANTANHFEKLTKTERLTYTPKPKGLHIVVGNEGKKKHFPYKVKVRPDSSNENSTEKSLDFKIVGAHNKVSFEASKMSQHEKVKLLLVGLGWQTDDWTFKKEDGSLARAETGGKVVWPPYKVNGHQLSIKYKAGDLIPMTPQLEADSYDSLPEGLGEQIGLYNTYAHRRNFIKNPDKDDKGLLNNIREDGRITGGMRTFGTTAGRGAQYNWVNAPSVQATYGENIRKIVIAPEGHKLIGVDMPSAHPRILADFTQNELFIKAVDGKEVDENDNYVGEDFHTVNSVLFSLNTKENVEKARQTQDHELISLLAKGRKTGKGGSYCTLYGGSAKKLESSIKSPAGSGQKLKDDFLNGLGLDLLLKEVEQTWKPQQWGRGSFITVLGGYNIWCESKHKIINYKALGSEAVVQKVAVNLICRKMTALGLKSKLILNVHDEVLFEVPEEELDVMSKLAANIYVEAAKELGLTLDWTSHAMIGDSYASCH